MCVLLTGLALSITEFTERFGCAPYGRHTFLACPRKVCQRRAPPTSGFRCAKLPSLRCRSGGRLTRAVPGPLSLSPHPCGSLPYAAPPLGLLKGTRSRACKISSGSSSTVSVFAFVFTFKQRSRRRRPSPLQEAEWNRRVRG
ncbi:hypothetical protein EQ831_06060 [Pseudomonas sp. ALS1279]|nr:hypothetical protein EQ831_06060 [Pseudomonas sp. ALS1279]